MEEVKYLNGEFCWSDLGTSDLESSKKFYAGLFGWRVKDTSTGDSVYSMCYLQDKIVCALYSLNSEDLEDILPHWLSYIKVDNLNVTAEKVEPSGGKLIVPPMDVVDVGRMAIIQDADGATVGLWEPKSHKGAEITNVPNSICWNELATLDEACEKKFYNKVFNWGFKSEPMIVGEYTTFTLKDKMTAGMMVMPKELRIMNIPPHWLIYFEVENCDESVKKAESLDGLVLQPATDIPDMGRFSVIQDPQGAAFGIIQFSN